MHHSVRVYLMSVLSRGAAAKAPATAASVTHRNRKLLNGQTVDKTASKGEIYRDRKKKTQMNAKSKT